MSETSLCDKTMRQGQDSLAIIRIKLIMKIGETINGYNIVSHINDGGFDSVYKVEKDGVQFAMKTVLPDADQDLVLRFRREVRLLMSVKDEHVIEVLDYDLDNDTPYYIMPFCSDSLSHEIKSLSDEKKVEAIIDFCKGIFAIHQAGICHRDIKPDNALFLDGILKITDLGGGRFANRDTTTLTQFGYIGTEGYMPPEYKTDPEAFKKGTRQGDIYMIGKSIYNVMSNGGDVSNVDLANVNPGIAPIIERCLKTNLNERYNNVDEIIKELQVFKSVKQELKNGPKSLDEILREKGHEKYDDLYNLLLNEGNDEQSLYLLLQKLDDNILRALFAAKSNQLNNYIGIYDQILRNPQGWIQTLLR